MLSCNNRPKPCDSVCHTEVSMSQQGNFMDEQGLYCFSRPIRDISHLDAGKDFLVPLDTIAAATGCASDGNSDNRDYNRTKSKFDDPKTSSRSNQLSLTCRFIACANACARYAKRKAICRAVQYFTQLLHYMVARAVGLSRSIFVDMQNTTCGCTRDYNGISHLASME